MKKYVSRWGMGLGSASLAIAACNVAEPPGSTGGLDGGANDGGAQCGRGLAVVTSDYKSTNIVLTKLDGATVSASFVSSAATKPGLSLAISGDVDVPSEAPRSGRVVLIDRFGTNVLTWMNLDTAEVIAQLPIGQGFESNPHDYIEVDDTRAFVSRYGTNGTPGAQPFDQGGDLLVVDTKTPAILGRIAMPEEDPELDPCPSGITRLGAEVVVSLGRWTRDFSRAGNGRFVGVSPITNAVTWTVNIDGLAACGAVAVSPSGKRLAVACSSHLDMTTKTFEPTKSDIVLYDATTAPPTELKRFGLGKRLDAGLQPDVTFVTDDVLFAKAYGGNATAGDRAFSLAIDTEALVDLGASTKPYSLGGVECSPGCGDTCLMADAERNKLRRWAIGPGGTLRALEDSTLETTIGLPPRSFGKL